MVLQSERQHEDHFNVLLIIRPASHLVQHTSPIPRCEAASPAKARVKVGWKSSKCKGVLVTGQNTTLCPTVVDRGQAWGFGGFGESWGSFLTLNPAAPTID